MRQKETRKKEQVQLYRKKEKDHRDRKKQKANQSRRLVIKTRVKSEKD